MRLAVFALLGCLPVDNAALSGGWSSGMDSEKRKSGISGWLSGNIDKMTSAITGRSGRSEDETDEQKILELAGFRWPRVVDLNSVHLQTKLEDRQKWGSCSENRLKARIDGYPSQDSVDKIRVMLLTRQGRHERISRVAKIQRAMSANLDPAALFSALIDSYDSSAVYLGRTAYTVDTEAGFIDGFALLKSEERMCESGFLSKPFSPLTVGEGRCREAAEQVVPHPDWPMGNVFRCLSSVGPKLEDVDRKILIDIEQIQKDMDRDTAGTAKTVMMNCEKISLIWTNRIVPWYEFAQFSTSVCFFLHGQLELPLDETLKGLTIFRDQVTRNSRYPAHRYNEYVGWLYYYLKKAFNERLPMGIAFMDPVGKGSDTDLILSLDAFLSSPVPDTFGPELGKRVWEFLFKQGRPGLVAWFLGSVLHANACVEKYMSERAKWEETLSSERDKWSTVIDQLLATEQGVGDYTVRELMNDMSSVQQFILAKPWRAFFGPKGVEKALNYADSLLQRSFSRGRVSQIEETPRRTPIKSLLGARLKAQNRFSAKLDSSSDEEDSLAKNKETVPESVSFLQLVDMVDFLIDEAMEYRSGAVRLKMHVLASHGLSVKGDLESALATLNEETTDNAHTFVSTTGWGTFPRTELKISHFESPSTYSVLESSTCRRTQASVGLYPSGSALLAASDAFLSSVQAPRTSNELALTDLIWSLDPLRISIDGVTRTLPERSYGNMLKQLEQELADCESGRLFEFHSTADLHGCKRPVDSIDFGARSSIVGRLTLCLKANEEKLNAVLSNHLWALNQLVQVTKRQSGPFVPECEEILAVYTLVFVNDPDALVPLSWCTSLQRNGLSKLQTVYAMSLLANRLIGLNKFGPGRAEQYVKTLASFWLKAIEVHFSNLGTIMDGKIQDVGLYSQIMLGLSMDSQEDDEEFWRFVFSNGVYGVSALMVLAIRDTLMERNVFGNFLNEANRFLVGMENGAKFEAIVNMVNILTDSAMANNHVHTDGYY